MTDDWLLKLKLHVLGLDCRSVLFLQSWTVTYELWKKGMLKKLILHGQTSFYIAWKNLPRLVYVITNFSRLNCVWCFCLSDIVQFTPTTIVISICILFCQCVSYLRLAITRTMYLEYFLLSGCRWVEDRLDWSDLTAAVHGRIYSWSLAHFWKEHWSVSMLYACKWNLFINQ